MMMGCMLARLPGDTVAEWTSEERDAFLVVMLMPERTPRDASPRVVAKGDMLKKMLETLGMGSQMKRRATWGATTALLMMDDATLQQQFRVHPGEPDPPEPGPDVVAWADVPAGTAAPLPVSAPSHVVTPVPAAAASVTLDVAPSPPPSPLLDVGYAAPTTAGFIEQVWKMPMPVPRPRGGDLLHVVADGDVYYAGLPLRSCTVIDLTRIGVKFRMPINGRYLLKDELLEAITIYVARMHGATCAKQMDAVIAAAAKAALE